MPWVRLLTISILSGSRLRATVWSSWMLVWKPPSPATSTTGRPAEPNDAPIAAGRPKPIEPSPPEVRKRWSGSRSSDWAAHIWCWPTSAT